MGDRRQPRWLVPLLVVSLLATLVTWLAWPAGDEDRKAAPRPGFLLSYVGADTRLAGMSELAAAEQLRDWARLGLAADLGLDTTELVDGFYDTLPVRDEGFTDLARQPVGPGRALFADDVLHLLVPRDDPHEDRTVGLLLDQHRTDAGADPRRVRVHHYTVNQDSGTIRVESDDPVATKEFRAAHGYVRLRVDSADGLTDFLTSTRALSTVDMVGDEVWAGGWRLSEKDGQPLTRADVAVLQRGYGTSTDDTTPGFSLDPGPMETADDLTALVPGLSAELRDGITDDTWSGPHFGSANEALEAVKTALLGKHAADAAALGLPADRKHLWALWIALGGASPYGEARYDGDLRGTEVGMTLFYTDYVAKDWVNGVGTGVPAEAVEGFEPDPLARTPWGHCEGEAGGESGRLWFGQNDAAYSFQDNRITIGAQPTRLFARSDGAAGEEIESSYSFGRGLRWWDQHYQLVAEYEPQYQRLDQIMRWGAALEWLGPNAAKLPSYDDIRDDLRFADWYRDHDELRERAPISFVSPPSATQESVLTVPSATYEDCGLSRIHGGVSLSDLGARKAMAGHGFEADLPGQVRRAGLYDEASTFDRTTGVGSVKQVSIDETGAESAYLGHTISRTADGAASVAITAGPRAVTPMGTLKVWRDQSAPRTASTELAGGNGKVSQRVEFEGHDLGDLTAVSQGDVVTVRWRGGIVDRMRNAAESLQNRLSAGRGDAPVDGVLYSMRDADGRVLHRVGAEGEPWLTITPDAPTGAELSFRLGAPGPRFSYATMVPEPALPSGASMKITPATADSSAVAVMGAGPPSGASPVRVTTMDGRTSTLYRDGDSVWVASDDPVLGHDGTEEGAALVRDFPRVAAATRAAVEADDGLLRAVVLGGDGVALVGADGVRLVGAADRMAHEVLRVTRKNGSPVFAIVGDHLVSQKQVPLRPVPGSRQDRRLGDVLNGDETVLIPDSLRATLPDGPAVADALPRDREVTVVEADVPRGDLTGDAATWPDVLLHGGEQWWRVLGGQGGGSGGVSRVVMVCPEDAAQSDESAESTDSADAEGLCAA
jgi:hypothetical protein